jgi:hypothetical protein
VDAGAQAADAVADPGDRTGQVVTEPDQVTGSRRHIGAVTAVAGCSGQPGQQTTYSNRDQRF